MSILSGLLSGAVTETLPLYPYKVWKLTHNTRVPFERRWKVIGEVRLPYPYWNAVKTLQERLNLSEGEVHDLRRYGRFEGKALTEAGWQYIENRTMDWQGNARAEFEAGGSGLLVMSQTLRDSARHYTWPELRMQLEPLIGADVNADEDPSVGFDLFSTLTAGTASVRPARRRRRHHYHISPPYNVIFDIRTLPGGGAEHGAAENPYLLGLPGMVDAVGLVMQGWPWGSRTYPVGPMDISVSDLSVPEALVAIDRALEAGLA